MIDGFYIVAAAENALNLTSSISGGRWYNMIRSGSTLKHWRRGI